MSSSQMVEVYSVMVDCTVTSRFAHTVMTSKALNRANTSQEIFFEVELPKTAFITNFSMEIDGEVYVGEVKEKEKAKKQYEKAVSSGQTAGLVKASGRKMEKFSVSVNIAAKSNVTFVLTYEELLQRKLGQYEILTRVKPKQPVQEFQAHISFSPTLEQQRKCPGCEGTIIDGDFIIKYDVKREKSLGEIQIVNGYFVHFFAPPDLPRVPKNVAFVIDRSGSMAGSKIQQTRGALKAILEDLHQDDHFALILFDSNVVTWRNSLTKATKENVTQAIAYVKKLKDKGATNMNDGLLRAVGMLVKERKDGSLPERSADMIILLTDGMPNHGVSNLQMIQDNVRSAIDGKMSLFCLGFGNDVAYSFLDLMSKQNKGLTRRIFVGSDATLQLQGFYEEVSSPLLLEVDLRYPDNAVDFLTKNHYSQLFNGSEIVVSGQLTNNDPDNFLVEVFEKEYIFGNFSERLWAYLTIQQLLENRFDLLNCVCQLYRSDGDPHFMIELPERDDALCFNINDKPGTILNLVRDPKSGFVVNGQIIGKKKVVPDGKINTYFGRLGIIHGKLGVRLEVSTQGISVFYDGKQVNLLWSDAVSIKETNLTVTLRHSVKFEVIRHTKVWKRRRDHQDYLGFYTLDSHHLSAWVHGLLGQFYHGVEFEVTDLRPGPHLENVDATMYVKGQTLNVTRHWQKDFSSHVKDGESIPCWFINNDGAGLIDGRASDYTVSGLFKTVF
uniref:Inter-alpha-trypsin inhibitor heavy chain H3 n=1 Tax=Sparus aurata TaxID=8175 RepID=A0A671VER8_SPAAU